MEDVSSSFSTLLRQEHASLDSKISQGELVKPDKTDHDCSYLVKITTIRGKFLRKYGFTLADGLQCLYPEEACYLSQCDDLQVYDGGLPLSLQQLFNTLFRDDLEFASYLVYARFTRQGFVLRRRKSLNESNDQPPDSKIIILPIDQSSQDFIVESNQDTMSDEFIIVSPESKPYSETPDFVAPSSFHSRFLNMEKYRNFIIFDVYDDRKGNFKKNTSSEPTFVLLVLSLSDTENFPPNECFRRNFCIRPEAEILVAVVNNGDVYFMRTNSFSIPTIKRVLI
ncbi:unnamed protein product [Hymenolepis diminuta]|uniref:tRNA_int_end_N2 domain-containing protein n=1 Tax=Hymenolepis diminuta TaxID=6216 RepID=A0A0R3SSS2_HYMDI|nr:unnamed protein product [Hymenolepis diminuta]